MVLPSAILGRHLGRRQRPAYAETRIIEPYAALEFRRIGGTDEVERLGVVDQRDEAVRKAARNVHHRAVFGAEIGAEPLQVGRAIGSQVDDDIMQGAPDAAY